MIVLGGGVSAKEGLLAEINRRMLTHLQTFELKDFVPEIVTCHYQNDANLIGAAANFQAKTNWNYKETADCYSLQSAVSLFIACHQCFLLQQSALELVDVKLLVLFLSFLIQLNLQKFHGLLLLA